MRNGKRNLLIVALGLATLLLAAMVSYNALGARQAPLQAGQGAQGQEASVSDASAACGGSDAPMLASYDAVIYTGSSEKVSLTELADGKPLVINVWATWCPHCLDEMPDFQKIYAQYGDRVAFAFVDATDGVRETVDKASAWLSENGLDDLPAYYDIDYDLIGTFGIRSYPTTIIVSPAGEILTVSSGRIDPDLVSGALSTLV